MSFDNLTNNLINIIKESQIKLGYDSMPIGVNYISSSLANLLGCDVSEGILDEFCTSCDELGEISYSKIENGYRFTVSSKGVDYVHSLICDDDFLVKFISAIRSFDTTIDDIIAVFRQYSDDVVVERVDNDEFDYLIYFADGTPDEFWYCIDTEDIGMTYHRFTKQDYLDFNF